ncbi:MAG: MaoC family dehydratase [Myxococcota bacterium]
MAARKLYFESVRVGDELPAMAKTPIDRVQLARYAGASGDFNPVHVDETYARGVGMPSVYAPGMLIMGFLGQLLADWARGAQLRKYNVKFIKMVWPGDTVVCKGRVTDRFGEGGRYFVDIDLWAENQKGELVLRGQAQIQLFYSLEDENRQRAGQAPIVVNVPRENLVAQAASAAEVTLAAGERKAGKVASGAKKAPAKKSAKKATAQRSAKKPAKKPVKKAAPKPAKKAKKKR